MPAIIDGSNRRVPFNPAAIKKAVLGPTSMVTLESYDSLSISFFESKDGNEIDVYDPNLIRDQQTVYEPKEIDLAIKHFMELCEKEQTLLYGRR